MANIKSAKKKAKQDVARRQRNLSRKTALKTVVKKVLASVQAGDYQVSVAMLRDAESQLARACGKGLLHKNAVARKVSRLSKKIAALNPAKAEVAA